MLKNNPLVKAKTDVNGFKPQSDTNKNPNNYNSRLSE
jgi:hypothetical protein